MRGLVAAAASLFVLLACGTGGRSVFDDPDGGDGGHDDGTSGGPRLDNDGGPRGDGGNAGDGGDCSAKVVGLIRDFRDDHPDFESVEGLNQGSDPGIVQDLLGADHK